VIRHAVHVSGPVIAAGRRHSLGLCGDGTVVAAGTGTSGECRVEDWVRVVGVAAGNVHTASNTGRSHSVGLGAAGTVMATGWNGDGQCDVASWRGVALVAAGWRRILGLVKDGTVAAAGRLREGACDVSQWREVVALWRLAFGGPSSRWDHRRCGERSPWAVRGRHVA
jgi:alpha-tubulin suppressor-like RCC1 family protein